jgi:predicted signal transduction protein with EAL and GGDEF domain
MRSAKGSPPYWDSRFAPWTASPATGGEEFVIITPDNCEGAAAISERILKAVARRVFDDGKGGTFHLTISIGQATYPNHAVTEQELIKKADLALYQGEEQGRNRVCYASDPPTQNNNAKIIRLGQSPQY